MENTKIKIVLKPVENTFNYEIASIKVWDPKTNCFVIENVSDNLKYAIIKQHWIDVRNILRNNYNCCANNLEPELIFG